MYIGLSESRRIWKNTGRGVNSKRPQKLSSLEYFKNLKIAPRIVYFPNEYSLGLVVNG